MTKISKRIEYPDFNHCFNNVLNVNYKLDESLSTKFWKNIPNILRVRNQWVWLEVNSRKLRSKPSIYLCRGVSETEALEPKNYLKLNAESHGNGIYGQGFVLRNEPLIDDLRLIAVEINISSGFNLNHITDLWTALGEPYL